MTEAEGVYLSIVILVVLVLVVFGYFYLLKLSERVGRLERLAEDQRKSVAGWIPNGPPPVSHIQAIIDSVDKP